MRKYIVAALGLLIFVALALAQELRPTFVAQWGPGPSCSGAGAPPPCDSLPNGGIIPDDQPCRPTQWCCPVGVGMSATPRQCDAGAECRSNNLCVRWGCGNGYVDPNEMCDDGNTVAGDGCDSTCMSEGGAVGGAGALAGMPGGGGGAAAGAAGGGAAVGGGGAAAGGGAGGAAAGGGGAAAGGGAGGAAAGGGAGGAAAGGGDGGGSCPDRCGYPTCTPEGWPIFYFIDPCMTFGTPACGDIQCEDGRRYPTCDDGGNPMNYLLDPCRYPPASSSRSSGGSSSSGRSSSSASSCNNEQRAACQQCGASQCLTREVDGQIAFACTRSSRPGWDACNCGSCNISSQSSQSKSKCPEMCNRCASLGEECKLKKASDPPLYECFNGVRQGWGTCDCSQCAASSASSESSKAFCGNGKKDPGEECDKGAGNSNEPYSCRTNCTLYRCGDGIQDSGKCSFPYGWKWFGLSICPLKSEECDDGNTVDNDGCTNACTFPKCGDGIVQNGRIPNHSIVMEEECDDKNTKDYDGCSRMCKIEFFCGDGAVNNGEECDDGNKVGGDGCSDVCALEGGMCGKCTADRCRVCQSIGESCFSNGTASDCAKPGEKPSDWKQCSCPDQKEEGQSSSNSSDDGTGQCDPLSCALGGNEFCASQGKTCSVLSNTPCVQCAAACTGSEPITQCPQYWIHTCAYTGCYCAMETDRGRAQKLAPRVKYDQLSRSYNMNGVTGLVTGDFNNDGRMDMVINTWRTEFGGEASILNVLIQQPGGTTMASNILPQTGAGTFEANPWPMAYLVRYDELAKGDFNGDGNLDLITTKRKRKANEPMPQDVAFHFGNGNGTFDTGYTTTLTKFDPDGLYVADFDRDGRDDVMVNVKNQETGTDGGALMIRTRGARSTLTLGNPEGIFLASKYVRLAADVNGDGNPDLITTGNPSTSGNSDMFTHLGNGDGTFQNPIPSLPFCAWSALEMKTGDFNKDGKTDLAVSDSAMRIRILQGDGSGRFQLKGSYKLGNTGNTGGKFAVADVACDGNEDVIVLPEGTTALGVMAGKGNGTFEPGMGQTDSSQKKVIAVTDIDGDTDNDVLVLNGDRTMTVHKNTCISDGTLGGAMGGAGTIGGLGTISPDGGTMGGIGTIGTIGGEMGTIGTVGTLGGEMGTIGTIGTVGTVGTLGGEMGTIGTVGTVGTIGTLGGEMGTIGTIGTVGTVGTLGGEMGTIGTVGTIGTIGTLGGEMGTIGTIGTVGTVGTLGGEMGTIGTIGADGGPPLPLCGNGVLNTGEECDDGNLLNGDGCSAECRLQTNPRCGDNIVTSGEQCDDGNILNNDGCSSACIEEQGVCGNGILNAGEQCDDANRLNGDGCSGSCLIEQDTVLLCGDNIISAGEDCDDGNVTKNDGCSDRCQSEKGTCGDGALNAGESCEDGNTRNGDGCSAACKLEPNTIRTCGDGIMTAGEDCDDANVLNGDGCSRTCQNEPNCGNGKLNAAEQCEDGNRESNDGCSSTCMLERGSLLECGNGIITQDEQCDDGNGLSQDGCDARCRSETIAEECTAETECSGGMACVGGQCARCTSDDQCASNACARGLCEPTETLSCGNRVLEPREQCEDGNTRGGDGCSGACTLEPGVPLRCGDGIHTQREECDDGNSRDFDGCSSACFYETGTCGDGMVQQLLGEQCEPVLHDVNLPYRCATDCRFFSLTCGNGTRELGEECDSGAQNNDLIPGACRMNCSRARCGDRVLDPGETCDDGNHKNEDGCDRSCHREGFAAAPGVAANILELPVIPGTEPLGGSQAQGMRNNADATTAASLIARSNPPAGQTGPAAVAVMAAGASAGFAWMRRRRR